MNSIKTKMGRKDKLKLAREEIYKKPKDENLELSKDELKADLEHEKNYKNEYDIESSYIVQEDILKYVNDCTGNTICEYLSVSNIEQFIQHLHKKS